MPLPPEKRIRFYVFIVESPSAVNLYHGHSEAEVLRLAARLNNLHCISKLAVNFQAFVAAIQIGLMDEIKARPDVLPILHISAHGSKDGIQLATGEVVTWPMLREMLIPVNEALNNNLLVCMSTCEGYTGTCMAMNEADSGSPFFALVGNGGTPTWPETAVAFTSFYHLVANGHFIKDAVVAMRTASGNDMFWLRTAEEAKQGYLNFIKGEKLQRLPALKEEEEGSPSNSQLSKNLEKIPAPV